MLVQRPIYEQAVEAAAEMANKVSVGPALEEGRHIGSVVNEVQWTKIQDLIQKGCATPYDQLRMGSLVPLGACFDGWIFGLAFFSRSSNSCFQSYCHYRHAVFFTLRFYGWVEKILADWRFGAIGSSSSADGSDSHMVLLLGIIYFYTILPLNIMPLLEPLARLFFIVEHFGPNRT